MKLLQPEIRRLTGYTKPYIRKISVGAICVVTTNALSLWIPWLMKEAVDAITQKAPVALLVKYAISIIGITAFVGIFRFSMRNILLGISRTVECDLRNDFFRHLQTLPVSFFEKMRTGDIMSRAINDLRAIQIFLGAGIMHFINTIIVFLFAIGMMMIINVRLTFLALLPLPILTVLIYVFGKSIHSKFHLVQEHFSRISAKVQETLTGIRMIKAYCRENYQQNVFKQICEGYFAKNVDLIKVMSAFLPLIGFVAGLSFVAVLWWGGKNIIAGHMSIGDFVAFNGYLMMLIWPAIALGWIVNLYQRGLASMRRVCQIMDASPEKGISLDPTPSRTFAGEIEFKNLSFSYNGDKNNKWVLKDITFKINAGNTVAIVGGTASGKSTLAALLLRLYEVPPCSLFIDGVDITKIPVKELRRNIGYIPQESFLFSMTVGENIGFGLETWDEDLLMRVSFISALDSDISHFPQGLDTMVGERGITLSGGQKQRAAISRALAHDPPILILDDSFSNIDLQTEFMVRHRLKQAVKNKTCIIISHRISAVLDADEIIVLENGKIVEKGNHQTLLSLNGKYATLYRQQLLEKDLKRL